MMIRYGKDGKRIGWINDVLAEAAARGLSLSVTVTSLDPSQIELSEKVDQSVVRKLANSMVRRGWHGPPILVHGYAPRYSVVNGNHRLVAAQVLGRTAVPVVVLDNALDDFFMDLDLDRIAIEEVLEAANPGLKLKSAGTPKHRT